MWDTLVATPHGCIQLKEAAKAFHSQVAQDLIRLKLAELLTSQRQGKFRLIGKNIYVFQHSEYNECSRVKLSSFVACSTIEETIELVEDDHDEITDEFLPFLHANPILAMIYAKMLLSPNLPVQRREKLSANQQRLTYVRMHKKFRDDEDRCYTYDSKEYKYAEDTWSERLYHILKKCYKSEVEFTASKKGHAANDIIMKRMPADTTMDCLIFHGAPDLIVNVKPVVLAGVDVICEDGCTEDKNDESLPYKPTSIIPDQAGQLVACTYELMVAACLEQLVNGEECTAVMGCGLYIVRNSNVFRFMVTLNQNGITIQARCYVSCDRVISAVCKAVNDFINM